MDSNTRNPAAKAADRVSLSGWAADCSNQWSDPPRSRQSRLPTFAQPSTRWSVPNLDQRFMPRRRPTVATVKPRSISGSLISWRRGRTASHWLRLANAILGPWEANGLWERFRTTSAWKRPHTSQADRGQGICGRPKKRHQERPRGW